MKEVIRKCEKGVALVKNGAPVMTLNDDGEVVQAYKFYPLGALNGYEMLCKHLGLYEKDNAQQAGSGLKAGFQIEFVEAKDGKRVGARMQVETG